MSGLASNTAAACSVRAAACHGKTGLRPWLELVRLPNLVTAMADVAAGWAIAGAHGGAQLALLCGSSVALYAGGIGLNDVADAALDARERPERPIPSGRIRRRSAALVAACSLALGTALAASVSWQTGAIALALIACILSYDFLAKPSAAGPVNMGLCRALNLALGLSVLPAALAGRWELCLLPWVYIAAVTTISRGEVQGGRRSAGWGGVAIAAVISAVLLILAARHTAIAGAAAAAVFALTVVPAWLRAARSPDAITIRSAVRYGVLALVLIDASLCGIFAGVLPAIAVGLLYPASLVLARRFWVT